MKILQINTIAGSGSTGRIVIDILKTIHAHGDEGIIACAIDDTNEQNKPYIYKVGGSRNPRPVHAVAARITDRSGFYSKRATRKLVDYIDKNRFDIIHLHNIHGYYINLPILFNYIKEKNIKVIWTLHDCWTFTGHCTHFDFSGCQKWKTQCYDCPQKGRYPRSILLDSSEQNYNEKKALYGNGLDLTIVTPSKWLADLCKQSFLGNYDIRVIRNGIDLEKFYPRDTTEIKRKLGLENKKIVLAVCAGWSMRDIKNNRKGMADILKLSEMLSDEYQIVMVGFPNEEDKKCLPAKILGVTKTKSIDELAQWYSAADVFINPTYEDNFPTTNLEALACGTPVVTYNTGGSPEAIDEETGYIVEKNNIQQLRDAVIDCIDSQMASDKCIVRSKLYDKHTCFEQYYLLYEEAIR